MWEGLSVDTLSSVDVTLGCWQVEGLLDPARDAATIAAIRAAAVAVDTALGECEAGASHASKDLAYTVAGLQRLLKAYDRSTGKDDAFTDLVSQLQT